MSPPYNLSKHLPQPKTNLQILDVSKSYLQPLAVASHHDSNKHRSNHKNRCIIDPYSCILRNPFFQTSAKSLVPKKHQPKTGSLYPPGVSTTYGLGLLAIARRTALEANQATERVFVRFPKGFLRCFSSFKGFRGCVF